ncbi:MAG: hypothetical protein ABIK33_04875 [candidate division WOR-3 bacterium]
MISILDFGRLITREEKNNYKDIRIRFRIKRLLIRLVEFGDNLTMHIGTNKIQQLKMKIE